jgi:hypothetical protein
VETVRTRRRRKKTRRRRRERNTVPGTLWANSQKRMMMRKKGGGSFIVRSPHRGDELDVAQHGVGHVLDDVPLHLDVEARVAFESANI